MAAGLDMANWTRGDPRRGRLQGVGSRWTLPGPVGFASVGVRPLKQRAIMTPSLYRDGLVSSGVNLGLSSLVPDRRALVGTEPDVGGGRRRNDSPPFQGPGTPMTPSREGARPGRVLGVLGILVAMVLALVALPAAAWAEVRLQLRVSANRVTLEDQLQVVVSAAGEFDAISELHSDGFDFQQGGHQTQVSILNGAMTRIESFTFIGSPSKPGTFKLGPVEASLGGHAVGKSNTVDVTVVGEEQAAGPGQKPEMASDLRTYAGQPVFVRPVLSVTQPYAGQQVIVAWELYWAQNMQLQGIRETSGPKLDGLDPEDLLKDHPKAEPVRIGGRPYMRQILHRVLINAPRAGIYPLQGPTLRVEVGDFFETKAAKLVSPTLEMQVRALPDAGRPADFDPASIGKLQMSATLQVAGKTATSHKVKVGERLLLQVAVTGEGNLLALKAVEPPKLQGMTVEALPGRTRDGVRTGERGSEGTRTWQYILSFSAPGHYELPAMAWASFDAATGTYVRSAAGPFEVVVEGEAQPAAAAAPTDAKAPPAVGNEPGPAAAPSGAAAPARRGVPRPIAPAMGLNADTTLPWHAQPWLLVLAALPWLAAAGRAVWALLQRRRQRLAPTLARAGAPGRAKERLKAAAQLEPAAGYGEAHRIIEQLIEELSGASVTGLADQALRERLAALGLSEAAVRNLADLMQHCDYARYAPGGNRPADLSSTCDTLAGLVDELAGALRTGTTGKQRAVGHAALILLAALLLLPAGRPAQAASLEASFAQGNQAYVAGDYAGAAKAYQSLLDHGARTPAVHYNLGNALAQSGHLGAAVGQYKQAQRLGPDGVLAADIDGNLAAVRGDLAEQARRRHETLHVFDESPEADVALARAAPRRALAVLAILAGALAVGLLWRRQRRGGGWLLGVGAGLATVVQLLALAWWGFARHVDAAVVEAIVVEEDASLAPCQGVGETIGLPEGLGVRLQRELADGRIEVRLTNGRQGCMQPKSLDILK